MEHVGYLYEENIRHDIYFDGRGYRYMNNKNNLVTITLPTSFKDKFNKEKDYMSVSLNPPSLRYISNT